MSHIFALPGGSLELGLLVLETYPNSAFVGTCRGLGVFPEAATTLPVLISAALENFPQSTEIYSRRKNVCLSPRHIIQVTSLVYGQKITPMFSTFVFSYRCGVDGTVCPYRPQVPGSPPLSLFCLFPQ